MIASCGALGLDWQATSLSMYAEAVEAHNERLQHDKPEAASDEFRTFIKRSAFRAGE